MKKGWRLIAGLVLATGCLAVPPAGASGGRAAGGEAVRVVWLKPERVPASRRPALTDLLVQAVSGRPLRGFEVRDSRPSRRRAGRIGHAGCARSACGMRHRRRDQAAPA